MSELRASDRSGRTLLVVLAVAGVLAALGLLIGFYDDLDSWSHDSEAGGLARAIGAVISGGENAFFAVTRNELGAKVLLAVLTAGSAALLLLPGSSRKLMAVAGTTFTEARRGGALWLAVIGALVVAVGAPFLDFEGGPAGRLKMILSFGMGAAALVGMLLAVVLPAMTFSRETETRSIFIISTKPVPRWAISGGKLLGVGAALAAAIALIGAGTAVAARAAMQHEASRPGSNPDVVKLNLEFYRDRYPQLIAADQPPEGEKARAVRIVRGQSRTYTIDVPDGVGGRKWLLMRLHARPGDPLLPSARVKLDFAGAAAGAVAYSAEPCVMRDRSVDVPVPASVVQNGRIVVSVVTLPDDNGYYYPVLLHPKGGVALAVAGNGLEMTLLKSLALLWLELMVVAAVTLAAAGVLSFPVAAVVGAATVIFGQLSGLAVGLLQQSVQVGADEPAQSLLGQLVRKLAAGELALLPDFAKVSASDYLARGEVIPWGLLAGAVILLLVVRAIPVAIIGALAFARREVGV